MLGKIADSTQEEKFKQTEIGLIPEDWEVVRLGDVFDMQQGKAMSSKSRLGISPQPFLRTVNVLWGHVDLSTLDSMDFTDEEITKLCLQPGDLLLCEGGEIGRTAMWRGEIKVCGYQNHIHRLRKQREDIWSEFYMYWLQAAFLILGLYAGEEIRTTIPNLSRGRLKSFLVPKPPLPEQQKIATVLSTIQRAIEHQDKIIEATRKLKKSLMHTLFTEGLNGEEQKETEIGLIPKSWDVMRLGDVCKKPQYGLTASATQIDTGSKFLRISDIQNQKVYWNDIPCCECSEEELKKYKLEKRDIVIARIGATTGKSYLLDESTPLSVFGSYLIRIKTKEELNPDYLYQIFNSERYWEQINKNKGGRLKGGVNSSVLVNLKIPLPPLPEQQQIAHILSTVDKKIEIEKRRKTTFKELFKTMLHKLMSGEMRLKEVEI